MDKVDFAAGLFVGSLLTATVLIVLGMTMDTNFEKCSKRYSVPDDVMECVWLLENN